jgi:hypothetical protein
MRWGTSPDWTAPPELLYTLAKCTGTQRLIFDFSIADIDVDCDRIDEMALVKLNRSRDRRLESSYGFPHERR